MTTLEIPINKFRIIVLAILFILSILLGVGLTYYLYLDGNYSLKLIIVLLAATPILLFVLWFSIKKIIDKRPGLVLDSRGILDTVNLTEIGIVSWSTITNVSLVKHQFSHFLIVQVQNNDMILSRLSGFKKNMAKNNIEKFGTPFIINVSNLKFDKLELFKMIQKKLPK